MTSAQDRAETARQEFAALEESVAALGDNEVGLDETYQSAREEADRAADRMRELVEAQRSAISEQRSLRARVDALGLGLKRRDGTGALLQAHDRLDGLLGPVSALITVRAGAEAAVAAALGTVADAVAVADLAAAATDSRVAADFRRRPCRATRRGGRRRSGRLAGTARRADPGHWTPCPRPPR